MTEPLVDIGLNLTNKRFYKDREEALLRARLAGVHRCILTGTSLEGSEQAIALCKSLSYQFPNMLTATVGVHPHEASSVDDATMSAIENLATENRGTVVAIGETGLDFNRNFSPPDRQITSFERHLELAHRLKMPLFLHERDAHSTQLEIVQPWEGRITGVIHCFTGNLTVLTNYLDMGFYIGITGWVCDERRGAELQSIIRHIPLDRLLIETDAPYLLPRTIRPRPKDSRNEPAFLPEVVQGIAAHTAYSYEEIARATTENAATLFGLEGKH